MARGRTAVLEMAPCFPFLLSKGPGIPTFLPLAGRGQTRGPGTQASPQSRARLDFSKDRVKRKWGGGSPGAFWRRVTPGSDSPSGLWLLNYWLMEGLSGPHTVLCETGMRSPTQLTASSIWRKKRGAGHQRALWHRLIPREALLAKGSGPQSNPLSSECPAPRDIQQTHCGKRSRNGNFTFLLSPSCHG